MGLVCRRLFSEGVEEIPGWAVVGFAVKAERWARPGQGRLRREAPERCTTKLGGRGGPSHFVTFARPLILSSSARLLRSLRCAGGATELPDKAGSCRLLRRIDTFECKNCAVPSDSHAFPRSPGTFVPGFRMPPLRGLILQGSSYSQSTGFWWGPEVQRRCCSLS